MTKPSFRTSIAASRAVTLVEMLVALLIATILIASVVSAFMALLRISEDRETEFQALQNARYAIELISGEVKPISALYPIVFVGTDNPLGYGDGIDDDGDGAIDEEEPNGFDDDGDFVNHHATAGPYTERHNRTLWPDFGDYNVDEDLKFHSDTLTYRLYPLLPGYDWDEVTYRIEPFEGRNRVLVRNVSRWLAGVEIANTTTPVAFDVLSFNCLYWNPNATPAAQTWLETWNHAGPFSPPGFQLPAAVMICVTVNADRAPLEAFTPGKTIRTFTLRSIVSIETVIQDSAFPRDP